MAMIKKELSDSEIYRKIAIYNIYKRSLKILKDNKLDAMGSESKEKVSIYIPDNKKRINLFNFEYSNFSSKNDKIGLITLDKGINDEQLKVKIGILKRKIEALIQAKQDLFSYQDVTAEVKETLGNMKYQPLINFYEKQIAELTAGFTEEKNKKWNLLIRLIKYYQTIII